MTYSEKLKHPKWQERRLRVFERDEFCCSLCKSCDKTLHVHHLRYGNYNNPWDSELEDLTTVCELCHSVYEYAKKINNIRKVLFYDKVGGAKRYILLTNNRKALLVFCDSHNNVECRVSLSIDFLTHILSLINE